MYQHLAGKIIMNLAINRVFNEVADYIGSFFKEEKEEVPVRKKKVKRRIDKTKWTDEMTQFTRERYDYWQANRKFVEPDVHCKTQADFTNYINEQLGTKRCRTSIMQIARTIER